MVEGNGILGAHYLRTLARTGVRRWPTNRIDEIQPLFDLAFRVDNLGLAGAMTEKLGGGRADRQDAEAMGYTVYVLRAQRSWAIDLEIHIKTQIQVNSVARLSVLYVMRD